MKKIKEQTYFSKDWFPDIAIAKSFELGADKLKYDINKLYFIPH